MAEHRVRLRYERVQGLRRAAAHEIHERLHELRPLDVHLRGEAQREDACDDRVGDRVRRAGERAPRPQDRAQVSVGPVPRAVQRAVPMLGTDFDTEIGTKVPGDL